MECDTNHTTTDMHEPQLETQTISSKHQDSPKHQEEIIPEDRPSQEDIHLIKQRPNRRRRVPTWLEQYELQINKTS